jgi:hypothetical protein
VDVDLAAGVHAGMDQRFGQRLVGFGEVDVLADEGDVDLVLRVLERVDQRFQTDRSAALARMPSLWQTISSSIWSCSMAGIL